MPGVMMMMMMLLMVMIQPLTLLPVPPRILRTTRGSDDALGHGAIRFGASTAAVRYAQRLGGGRERIWWSVTPTRTQPRPLRVMQGRVPVGAKA